MTVHDDPDPPAGLARFPLLFDLDPVELGRLAALAREKHYGKGEVVFQKGDAPSSLHLVVSGLIKEVCQSAEGAEKILELVEAGQSFGEAAVFLDGPYPYSAVALNDTTLLQIDRSVIHDLIVQRPAFVNRMVLALAGRVFTLMRDVESYTVQNPIQRVACYLYGKCGDQPRRKSSIVLPATKQAIASRLGMTPEALSRILRDFADAGLIVVQGSRIDVLDARRLRDFM